MSMRDPRIDAYIEKSEDFAKPILEHLREVVHEACPEVEETVRWSFPHFDYKGMMCSMAAFKAHCTFGFWNPELVVGGGASGEKAMGEFGRITAVSDLPSEDALRAYVRKAMALKDSGAKRPRVRTDRKPPFTVPVDLKRALAASPVAEETFRRFSPGRRREYVEWITEAKREETRARRLAQAVEWMAEGKPRNWKYMK